MNEVHRDRGLRTWSRQHQQVGETMGGHAMQADNARRPLVRELQSVTSDQVEPDAVGVKRAELKAGGKDEAVQVELDTVRDHAVLVHSFKAFALSVDERHIRVVEG